METRHLRALFALGLIAMLPGCIAAAVAVPALTAFGAASERSRTPVRAATPVPAPEVPWRLEAGEIVQLTPLTELPPPTAASPAQIDRWRPFVDYALQQVDAAGESALLTKEAALGLQPRRRSCPDSEPAVIIDLDSGAEPFAPAEGAMPAPGLAEALARLRAAGIVVLWVSQASANQVQPIAGALRRSGLDPSGRDPLLLVRHEEERKHVLREEANEDVCVIAIAGDRRADFDELFDYLKIPEDSTPLDAMLGSGWFLVPPPFE